jgi:hypothetical protein
MFDVPADMPYPLTVWCGSIGELVENGKNN